MTELECLKFLLFSDASAVSILWGLGPLIEPCSPCGGLYLDRLVLDSTLWWMYFKSFDLKPLKPTLQLDAFSASTQVCGHILPLLLTFFLLLTFIFILFTLNKLCDIFNSDNIKILQILLFFLFPENSLLAPFNSGIFCSVFLSSWNY